MKSRIESETKKQNRVKLTKYWESRGVFIPDNESIDDYIVVPGEKSDWLLYPIVKWLRGIFSVKAK